MSAIIPTFRYADARAAIDFLCAAFGFERHLVVDGEGDAVAHAQLVLGRDGMIMLGTARDDAFGRLQRPPEGFVTSSPYIVVEDVDGHHARAAEHGATIVHPPEDQAHGGRLYQAKDPEGNVWSFGSYDPWTD
ncbi:MAG TPA: VOC family protein [Sandaracinaceae bacterium LLY-WYZ-13_1]|nr:VOC family protein [Sandaracinaceae bacterium LLY-WYZ-13_1]